MARRYAVAPFTDVAVEPTGGHPLVVARTRPRRGYRKVLLYGHYDVQPATPLAAWRSPPFEPEIQGGNLYARGASDDKGQLLVHLHALEALYQSRDASGLPVDVIVLLDGEEEVGSPHLRRWLARNRDSIGCDVVLVSDTRIPSPHQPALTTRLRGSLSAELVVAGPPADLHSGAFGGTIHNPVHALSDLISSMHDKQGRIRISGFYDDVTELGPRDRIRMRREGPSDDPLRRATGVARLWGEPAYSAYERTTIRPALNVTGISGGYEGPGLRNAIPAFARARLNVRLVPDQDPHHLAWLLRSHIDRFTPATVSSRLTVTATARPAVVPAEHDAVVLAAEALTRTFGRRPVSLFSGGTIPAVSMLQEELGATPILMGFALPDDNMHAPNEKVHIPTLVRGVDAVASFLAGYAAL